MRVDGQPPFASTPILMAAPTASRTACTRCRSVPGSIPTLTFIFVKPFETAHRAISAAFAGSTPETDHFVGTERDAGVADPDGAAAVLPSNSQTCLPWHF